jgi:hypothetical protein
MARLDRLQLINASARFELLSANQQLLDFHVSRLLGNQRPKFRPKKHLQASAQQALIPPGAGNANNTGSQ